MTAEQAANFLARQATAQDDQKCLYHAFAIQHRADGRVISEVGISLGYAPESKGEIDFALHPAYQGQGYAMEALGPLLQYAFLR